MGEDLEICGTDTKWDTQQQQQQLADDGLYNVWIEIYASLKRIWKSFWSSYTGTLAVDFAMTIT